MNMGDEQIQRRAARGCGGIDAVQPGETLVGKHPVLGDVPVPGADHAGVESELKALLVGA